MYRYNRNSFEVEVTAKGGFPLIAKGCVQPAEPDVGINNAYVEEYQLFTMKGKPCNFLKLNKWEQEELDQAITDAVFAEQDDY